MTFVPLPAVQDKYLSLLHGRPRAVVVGSGNARPVSDALQQSGLQLEAILVTRPLPPLAEASINQLAPAMLRPGLPPGSQLRHIF